MFPLRRYKWADVRSSHNPESDPGWSVRSVGGHARVGDRNKSATRLRVTLLGTLSAGVSPSVFNGDTVRQTILVASYWHTRLTVASFYLSTTIPVRLLQFRYFGISVHGGLHTCLGGDHSQTSFCCHLCNIHTSQIRSLSEYYTCIVAV